MVAWIQQRKTQSCQNNTLQSITVCLLISPGKHLHNEAHMLSVKGSTSSSVTLVQPYSYMLGGEPPQRNLRKLLLQYVDNIQPLADQTSDRQWGYQHLFRLQKVTLAYVSYGYCKHLNTFLSGIGSDLLNLCPACNDARTLLSRFGLPWKTYLSITLLPWV